MPGQYKRYISVIIFSVGLKIAFGQTLPTWKYLPQGPHTVGFTTMSAKGSRQENLSIGIWYPAEKGGKQMTFRDYIVESKDDPSMSDTAATNDFKQVLELPFLFHLDPIPAASFEKAISTKFFAYRNAPISKGRFPLVIIRADPQTYPETFEFLASNGFVVACVNGPMQQPANDSLLYVQATDILARLLQVMVKMPYVDTSRIAAFGHGGSIQPSFYLAMRNPVIKLLVNIDGGVFGPRSKTTLSPDYAPAKLKIPMLHVVTRSTNAEDDINQFNALSNPRYKLLVNNEAVSHHDFSIYGRVVDLGLGKRGGDAPIAEEVYEAAHKQVLYFLQHGALDKNAVPNELFTLSVFGQ